MKRAVTYGGNTFTPSANTLNLAGIPNFNIVKLYAVLDVTAGSILYAAGTPGFGYSVLTGTTLTLQASMLGCSGADELMIIYDDGDQATATAVQNIALSYAGALVGPSNALPVAVDAQASGLAQDTSVQSVVSALGTIGTSPPSLPGSSSGVMGLLRWLGGLFPSSNSKLQVADPGDTVANASFTRPANTTAYAAGELVANSTTAGSVAPMQITVTRSNGLACRVLRARLQKSGISVTNAQFVVHLYTVSPVCANGDGGAWLTTESAAYIGEMNVTMTDVFSDGAVGFGVSTVGSSIIFEPGSGQTTIYALLSTAAAYAPASGETFTLTLEVQNDE